MQLLEKTLQDKYYLISALKNNEDKQVLRLRHKELEQDIIKISYRGNADVYRTLLSVTHPNLPNILEVWQQDDRVCILEEYIEGMSVADTMAAKFFSEKEVRYIVAQLCDALDCLHQAKIIHRDIKPENVMLTKENRGVLIDFDAARSYKLYSSEDTRMMGTTGYAAPEQFGFAQSDERTDIFALGVLMNVMLTGRHPSVHLYDGKLRRVIEKCVRMDPAGRYPSVLYLKKNLL